MQEIEKESFELGFDEPLIVENVGVKGAEFLQEKILNKHQFGEVVILAGKGNNGADGMAIARHLRNGGHSVRAFLLFPDEKRSEELKKQISLAKNFGVKISEVGHIDQLSAYFNETQSQYLVLDAILGTGARLPVSDYLFDVINLANDFASIIVSVDIPSGITGNAGEMSSVAINADYTLAVGLPKTGLFISEGARHSGENVLLEVGFPARLLEGGDKSLLTPGSVAKLFKKRNKFAHKGNFGHTLVLGGSKGKTGAVIMASDSALKVGAGLVTAVTWEENYGELISGIMPEVMTGTIPISEDEVLREKKYINRFDSIVIGPGLSKISAARDTVLALLVNFTGPLVIDADAINVIDLSKDIEIFKKREWPTVLTPHIGEFARLVGTSTDEVLKRPLAHLKELVDRTKSSIVMKGSCSYLGFPNGEIHISDFPNDGMASGGSGDVLAGVIGGLLAQIAPERQHNGMFAENTRIYHAINLGVMVHTLAGKHAAHTFGSRAMSAGSIIENISQAFFELEELIKGFEN